MSMQGPHDKIIALAAKAALGPLNFQRKGRSRLWFADFGWWLAVVEFQPSSWSKGSYLNIAAHWLWSELGCISFDFGGRSAEFQDYQSDAQFIPAADRLAEKAADEAQHLIETFHSLEDTADILLQEVRSPSAPGSGYPGWPEYHAGVALALVGRPTDATEMFASVLERPAPSTSIVHKATERMARLVLEPSDLKHEVLSLIARQRDVLRLPSLDPPPIS
jgi:hypothetical protein